MAIAIFGALLTFAGAGAFVLSSLFYNFFFSDFFFNAGVVLFVTGPLIFFAYVVIGLCLEFYIVNDVPPYNAITITPARYPSQVPLDNLELMKLPEGLRRERNGPLNRRTGRRKKL